MMEETLNPKDQLAVSQIPPLHCTSLSSFFRSPIVWIRDVLNSLNTDIEFFSVSFNLNRNHGRIQPRHRARNQEDHGAPVSSLGR